MTDETFKPVYYRVETEKDLEKVPEKLFSELDKISKFIAQRFNSKNQIPMRLTEKEEFDFQNAEICHICDKEFKYDKLDDIEFDENYEPENDKLKMKMRLR